MKNASLRQNQNSSTLLLTVPSHFSEIVYFQDIFQSALAIVGPVAYIGSMLSNKNAYDSDSFGVAVDETCVFGS